ncbi:N-acetyltransferase [cf. Phormidesmis sp. LEGE 11477]|uniref:GNAT family N-acetyltransferase n=1 Tax=cf. Phormidesmis sp. LEGE 11477 TaxID=1828680 RepID=UPI001D14B34F|nr:GNAT family N-acetyltransferase [cf. Phormidesmis sp. LEGE 11477]
MSYVFPNAVAREKNLAKVFLPLIHCNLQYGNVELTRNGQGILLWISGDRLPLTLPMLACSGMIWMPFRIGQPAFNRLESHEAFCDREIEKRALKGYAYLWVVGVHPKFAGKGFGAQMIQSALSNMQRCGRTACVLRTDNYKNVALYEHLGFEQIYAGTEPSSQLPFWMLSHAL